MRSHANFIAEILSQHSSRLAKEEIALMKLDATSKLLCPIKMLQTELSIISLWITLGKGEEDIEKRATKIQQACSTLENCCEIDKLLIVDKDFTYRKLAESIKSLIGKYQDEKSDLFKKETEISNAEKLALFQRDATAFMTAQRQERYINSGLTKTSGAGALGVFSTKIAQTQSQENKKSNSTVDAQISKKDF